MWNARGKQFMIMFPNKITGKWLSSFSGVHCYFLHKVMGNFLWPPQNIAKNGSRPSRSHKLLQRSFYCTCFESLLFCDHFDGYAIILWCMIWIVDGFEAVIFSQKSWNFRTFSEDLYRWLKAFGKSKNSISRDLVASKFRTLRCLWWIMRNMIVSFSCDLILLDSWQTT